MRPSQIGFTLIELLIVIGIVSLLVAVLGPQFIPVQDAAYGVADAANLRTHHGWLLTYERKHGSLPMEGGYRFVMATWTSGVAAPTEENFDRFFTPGPARQNDLTYADLRKRVARGENPWPDLEAVDSASTHYVGRSRQHLKTRQQSPGEAWMADDNEGAWNLRDGTLNVLLCDGTVRTYSFPQLQELFGVDAFAAQNPVVTFGPDSPVPVCRTLANEPK